MISSVVDTIMYSWYCHKVGSALNANSQSGPMVEVPARKIGILFSVEQKVGTGPYQREHLHQDLSHVLSHKGRDVRHQAHHFSGTYLVVYILLKEGLCPPHICHLICFS